MKTHALALSLALLLGCSRTQSEPSPAERPVDTNPTAAPGSVSAERTLEAGAADADRHAGHDTFGKPAESSPGEIAWDAPASWESAPNPNAMRRATYKIPKAPGDKEDTELTVSLAGGGVEANVQRWAKQFGGAEAKTDPRKVNGLEVTVVEIKGTFTGGGGMMAGDAEAAKPKQMLLGAIVDAGDTQHFFKMVGPQKTVAAARKDFDAMVRSFRAK
jgi:hypothetical protein